MPTIWAMLAAYGLAFALQNDKMKVVTDRMRSIAFFDRMLSCIYCTGFHCGWMVWLATWGATGTPPASGMSVLPSMLLWAFSAAAACYLMDSVASFLEHRAESV